MPPKPRVDTSQVWKAGVPFLLTVGISTYSLFIVNSSKYDKVKEETRNKRVADEVLQYETEKLKAQALTYDYDMIRIERGDEEEE